MKFRKKPVEVEAIQAKEIARIFRTNHTVLPVWVAEAYNNKTIRFFEGLIVIYTLEGEMFANDDDWIIRGVKGELYPCKPDVFEMTYEAA